MHYPACNRIRIAGASPTPKATAIGRVCATDPHGKTAGRGVLITSAVNSGLNAGRLQKFSGRVRIASLLATTRNAPNSASPLRRLLVPTVPRRVQSGACLRNRCIKEHRPFDQARITISVPSSKLTGTWYFWVPYSSPEKRYWVVIVVTYSAVLRSLSICHLNYIQGLPMMW
jgi:hypothetical protein